MQWPVATFGYHLHVTLSILDTVTERASTILVAKATKELAVRNRLSGHSLEPTQRPYFHNYSILWSCQQTPRLVLIKG